MVVVVDGVRGPKADGWKATKLQGVAGEPEASYVIVVWTLHATRQRGKGEGGKRLMVGGKGGWFGKAASRKRD